MIWLWVVVLVVVLGVVAILAAGRDDAMGEVYEDRADRGIPTGRPLTSDDLDAVRLNTGLRGYRMDEVDALIDRMRADLMARERHEESSHQGDQPTDGEVAAADADAVADRPVDSPADAVDDERPVVVDRDQTPPPVEEQPASTSDDVR